MRRCHIFLLSVFVFLEYSLLFLIIFTRGKATYLLRCSCAFYFIGTVNFVSDVLFSLFGSQKIRNQIYDSFFVLYEFSGHVSCANINSAFLFFLISYWQGQISRVGPPGFKSQFHCSSILELWTSLLVSLSLSFLIITNEDDIRLTSYGDYEK